MLVLGALELSDRVQTVGALAGFAAILGLGVLSLLYFGQARELKRLRDWAGRAPERAAELQAQAATTAGEVRRVTAQPAGVRPPAPTAAATAARPPGPPAATPAGAAGAGAAAGAVAAGAAGAAGGTTPAPQGPTTAGGTPPTAPAPGTPGAPPAPGQKPGAAPANGNTTPGTDQPTVVVPGPGAAPGAPTPQGAPGTPPAATPAGAAASPAGSPPRPPIPPAGAQDSGEIAMPLRRVSAASTTVPPAPPPSRVRAAMTDHDGDGDDGDGGGRGGMIALIGGIAAVLVVGVLAATQLFGGDDAPPEQNTIAETVPSQVTPDTPREQTTTTDAPEVVRGNITVAVLNGTTVAGLARGAATKIETEGYKIGQVVNAADQSRPSTIVQFVEGSRDAALDVARVIGLTPSSVQAMDQGTRVLAGDEASVVVTVGADQSG